MTRHEITNAYFEWLYDLVCENRYHPDNSQRKLLMQLHDTEFTYLIPRDKNRAEDGKALRYRFAKTHHHDESVDYVMDCLDEPCSVLEMMVALAVRCEEDYMDDPRYGNRAAQWFWEMIVSLGLGSMFDSRYDKQYVDDILRRFLDRRYDPDGRGGLFRVRNCSLDLRKMEIWQQMCYFLGALM